MNIMAYGLGAWDADTLGNHRVLVRVDCVNETGADGVWVHIPWRLRDPQPEKRQLILVDLSSGQALNNLARLEVNREYADLLFQPASGPGLYAIYCMPYTGTVQAPYPQITYPEPQDNADPRWLAACDPAHFEKLPQAQAVEFQSIDALSSFYPMEVIATRSEHAALLRAHPSAPFLLFPEDREHAIRMSSDLPYRWIESGAGRALRARAGLGEFFSFQVGVYAARASLRQVQVAFSGLRNAQGLLVIPAAALRCFNLGGSDWTGKTFRKEVQVAQGQVAALWCGLEIPDGTAPGVLQGEVTVSAGEAGAQSARIVLEILPEHVSNYGDDQPERLARLRWLDSRIALDDEVVAPFTPIQVAGRQFEILGRKIVINESGFPERIASCFSPEMTGFDGWREILAGPLALVVADRAGQPLPWSCLSPATVTYQAPGALHWQASAQVGPARLEVQAVLEADGNLEYSVELQAGGGLELGDIRLELPYQPDAARYMLGLGFRGGYRPAEYDWQWDVAHKNQDALWLGDVNAGLQVTLKDEHYVRPLNTNFYTFKPLVSPSSWDNSGQGSIRLREQAGCLLVTCSSGPRSLPAGEKLCFNFRLAITPFKPIDTEAQWATRYFHRYEPVEEIAKTGANTINIHHANEINPFINYPFLRPAAMKTYIDQAHALGMKVKIYYTVRELTNHAPELFALRSLGDEVLSFGPGGGHSWLQEHLGGNYVTGWHVYALKDVAVVNSGTSRWHNFFLEGLDWLARNIGIDGLYIDDLAFDRVVMKRVRKILDRRRPGALIDLHSANQYRERDGFANSANLYMEHFPYLNRLWFGEYFDYNLAPDFWLVEVSGIPFGLMGEMLQDGGNAWRGMLYGMTGRLPWAGDPRPLWQAWDAFGLQGSRMFGYWSPRCPVRSGRDDILATVYLKEGRALVAIASWHPATTTIRLSIDWAALGIDPQHAQLIAPAIENFQQAAVFQPDQDIPVEPGKGWLLVIARKTQHDPLNQGPS